MHRFLFGLTLIVFLGWGVVESHAQTDQDSLKQRLALKSEKNRSGKISRGHYRVFEDRNASQGREIKLDIVVLHANGDRPQKDPVFVLAGGPGQAAATLWQGYTNSWLRRDRDIVLVNQRGTGGDNRIQLPPRSEVASPQDYLRPLMERMARRFT